MAHSSLKGPSIEDASVLSLRKTGGSYVALLFLALIPGPTDLHDLGENPTEEKLRDSASPGGQRPHEGNR